MSIGPCSPLPRLAARKENVSTFMAYELLTVTWEGSMLPVGMPIFTSQMSRIAVLLAWYWGGCGGVVCVINLIIFTT